VITRQAMLDLLWQQAEESIYLTKAEYLRNLSDWEIRAHVVDGVMVGIVLTLGPQFHFATTGAQWSLTRAQIRNYLGPIIAKYGFVQTKTPIEDTRQQRFNEILGFAPTGTDEFYTHYKLEQLRHA